MLPVSCLLAVWWRCTWATLYDLGVRYHRSNTPSDSSSSLLRSGCIDQRRGTRTLEYDRSSLTDAREHVLSNRVSQLAGATVLGKRACGMTYAGVHGELAVWCTPVCGLAGGVAW